MNKNEVLSYFSYHWPVYLHPSLCIYWRHHNGESQFCATFWIVSSYHFCGLDVWMLVMLHMPFMGWGWILERYRQCQLIPLFMMELLKQMLQWQSNLMVVHNKFGSSSPIERKFRIASWTFETHNPLSSGSITLQ